MITLKVGVFPGRLDDYAVEAGTTVREALEIADISVSDEQEVKLDGETVTLDKVLSTTDRVLIVGKRIKGAYN